jgi:peptide deformylase
MLELVEENHPILKASIPVTDADINLESLAKDMFLIMWSNGGIGLAAPQCGMAVRMFVMGPQEGPNYVCINPTIIENGPDEIGPEGCLSFPALWLNIRRPKWVHARYTTLNGEVVEQRFDGILARCYVHELDHLNGVTFTDRSSKLGLQLARTKQIKKLRKFKKVVI